MTRLDFSVAEGGGRLRRLSALFLLLQGFGLLQCKGDPANSQMDPAGGTPGATSTPVGGMGGTGTAGASGDTAAGGALAGGSNGGAGGQTTAAGAGGAAPTVSRRQACLAYAFASCRKYGACNGDPEVFCPQPDDCPDLVFSPGSTRTPEGLIACLPAIEDFDCELWVGGFRPDCITLGLRQPGEPCLYASQCASLICGEEGATGCGQCLAPIAQGQSCADHPTACDNGLECSSTNVCDPFVYEPPMPMPDPFVPLPAGSPCVTAADCEMDLACVDPENDGIGLCDEKPGLDAPCYVTPGGSWYCQGGLYCDAAEICRMLPPLGEACGHDATSPTGYCASDTFCNPTTDLCEARVPAGSPCEFLVQCSEGSCRSPGNAFAACVNDPAFPPEVQTTYTDCVCGLDKREGEACNPAFNPCEAGTSCNDGTCIAPESLGTFEAACGVGN
ncbi:MAG TPA: hypothetical protein VHO25_15660 [Polyangiaceae bacterium]|nr:hypothetical protein [Polyangiaceae bacterium]